jgi:hypothetical protein
MLTVIKVAEIEKNEPLDIDYGVEEDGFEALGCRVS